MFIEPREEECCGCGACVQKCPNKALRMEENKEGFLYPIFNSNLCIDCNLCNKICSYRNGNELKHNIIEAYVAQHKDAIIRKNSTSGGIFSAISNYILANNGVVYGAAFDDNMNVIHTRAENVQERDLMRGSKYVQSRIDSCYLKIKHDLDQCKLVLFVGTPCQVAAINKFFLNHRNYEKLITCDIICFGTPSPSVFQQHIRFLEMRFGKIKEYQCRPTKYGFKWGCDNDMAILENGTELKENGWLNIYRRLFYANIDKRMSCYSCIYTIPNRPGDFTIGDCSKASILVKNWNLYDGVSTFLVNTNKGERVFSQIKNSINYMKVDFRDIDQPPLHKPCGKALRRKEFFDVFEKKGYVAAIHKIYGRCFVLKYWIRHNLLRRKEL